MSAPTCLARSFISSSVRSWMGCGTQTVAGSVPKALLCASRADLNWSDAMNTDGMPRSSRFATSCTLHDTQEPQSARASTTAPHSLAILICRSGEAGFAKVCFMYRFTTAPAATN